MGRSRCGIRLGWWFVIGGGGGSAGLGGGNTVAVLTTCVVRWRMVFKKSSPQSNPMAFSVARLKVLSSGRASAASHGRLPTLHSMVTMSGMVARRVVIMVCKRGEGFGARMCGETVVVGFVGLAGGVSRA